jgi:hypothetical protein
MIPISAIETETKMKNLAVIAFVAASFCASAALADTATPMALNYAQFEATIAHVDLEKCGTAAKADTFCRLVVANEEFHVFMFSYIGDSPLVGIETYSADGIVDLLGSETVSFAK